VSGRDRPTWDDLRREIVEAGGEEVRRGATDHVVYRLPSGASVPLSMKHRSRTVPPVVRRKVRAAIAATRGGRDG